MTARRRWPRRLLVTAALALLADQLVQWTILRDGWLAGRRIAPFDPPIFTAAQADALERLRAAVAAAEEAFPRTVVFDRDLGWCTPAGGGAGDYTYSADGTRDDGSPMPPVPVPGRRRLVAVGCSFTHGDEVAGGETWTARLERAAPGWDVGNLGVGGQGIDQAWLRLRRDGLPLRPDVVWLGVLPLALRRTLGTYRPALHHETGLLLFKPRFELRDGALVHVPLGLGSWSDLVDAIGEQSTFLATLGGHDAFVRAAPWAYAPAGSHWTHWSAAARLGATWLEDRGKQTHDLLTRPDGELAPLAEAIIAGMAEETAAAGASFAVVLLPGRPHLVTAERGGAWWTGLLGRLSERGIEVIDLVPDLLAAGLHGDPSNWAPGGHYSPRGHGIVADLLAPRLVRP